MQSPPPHPTPHQHSCTFSRLRSTTTIIRATERAQGQTIALYPAPSTLFTHTPREVHQGLIRVAFKNIKKKHGTIKSTMVHTPLCLSLQTEVHSTNLLLLHTLAVCRNLYNSLVSVQHILQFKTKRHLIVVRSELSTLHRASIQELLDLFAVVIITVNYPSPHPHS